MAVNTDAVFFLSQQIAEQMIEHTIEGSIINISSVNGLVAEAGLAHYNASKAAVELITKSLAIELGCHGINAVHIDAVAIELGCHGINVNSICPGMIDTEIDDEFPLASGFAEYFNGHIPLGNRVGTVEECVGAAIFFASPAGRYVTGQNLVIDGGLLCEQAPRLNFMPPFRLRPIPFN